MRNLITRRAMRAFSAVSALAMIAAACGDDPVAPDDEPDTTRIVLTIGTGTGAQTVTWNTNDGSVTPAVTIPAGASRAVTAQFFRADNTIDPIITADEFRLDFNRTSGTAVTVTKNGNLGATITAGATAAQSDTFTLALFHLGEGHEEYESSPGGLTVTVQ